MIGTRSAERGTQNEDEIRPPAAPVVPPVAPAETVRVGADHLDRLLRAAAQLQTEVLHDDLVGRELTALGRQLDGLERQWAAARTAVAAELRRLAPDDEHPRLAGALAQAGVEPAGRHARSARCAS